MTLIGAACAGLLLWLASQVSADSLGGYWAFVGLAAAAGLTMALSQLLGGWTKWGWPQVSGSVFLLGFLPGLVAGGLVLLAAQPEDAWGTGWAGDLGVAALAEDLTAVLPAIAFGLGLLFGFTFDTAGRRVVRADEVVADERADVRRPGWVAGTPGDAAADEPVTAERSSQARPVATERRDDDAREPVAVGAGAVPHSDGRDPDVEREPRRRGLFTFHRR
jgi:hypothetical protein